MLRWLISGEIVGTRSPGGHWRVDDSALPTASAGLIPLRRPESRPLRVAIIEDDPSQAQALARLVDLLAPTASVHLAQDGLAAGLVLGATAPDVAFVDIEMPGLDGIEVIRRATKVPALSHTRFVVLSGRVTPERIAALAELGVTDTLRKPIRPDAIKSILDAARAARDRLDAR